MCKNSDLRDVHDCPDVKKYLEREDNNGEFQCNQKRGRGGTVTIDICNRCQLYSMAVRLGTVKPYSKS